MATSCKYEGWSEWTDCTNATHRQRYMRPVPQSAGCEVKYESVSCDDDSDINWKFNLALLLGGVALFLALVAVVLVLLMRSRRAAAKFTHPEPQSVSPRQTPMAAPSDRVLPRPPSSPALRNASPTYANTTSRHSSPAGTDLDEIVVHKSPMEKLGLLVRVVPKDGASVIAVEEGSKAEKLGLHPYVGRTLAYINGKKADNAEAIHAIRYTSLVTLGFLPTPSSSTRELATTEFHQLHHGTTGSRQQHHGTAEPRQQHVTRESRQQQPSKVSPPRRRRTGSGTQPESTDDDEEMLLATRESSLSSARPQKRRKDSARRDRSDAHGEEECPVTDLEPLCHAISLPHLVPVLSRAGVNSTACSESILESAGVPPLERGVLLAALGRGSIRRL